MKRRGFLKLLAVSAAAPTAVVTALGGEKKDSYISVAEAKTFYVDSSTPVRIYVEEITDNPIKAAYLGDKLVWREARRRISWSTEDINFLSRVGEILKLERTYEDTGERETFHVRVVVVRHETEESSA